MWEICGQTLCPGEKRQLVLRVPMGELYHSGSIGEPANGDYEIPATLICGETPGKTLLISASIHSGEYIGIPAVIRLGRELSPQKLRGNLILLHCVNTSGVLAKNYRTLPEDGYNLNSGYPGRADGSVGERIQAWFVREIFPGTDFIADLHGGSPEEIMKPLIFYPHAHAVSEESLAAAQALNVGFFLESYASDGEYSYAANALHIPGFLLERGSCVHCTEDEVDDELTDLRLLLNHLGMYDADPGLFDPALPRRAFGRTEYLESDVMGLWYPEVEIDTDVKKGQRLGRTEDFFGNVLSEYSAVADGHVVYMSQGLAVNPGDALVTYVLLESEKQTHCESAR